MCMTWANCVFAGCPWTNLLPSLRLPGQPPGVGGRTELCGAQTAPPVSGKQALRAEQPRRPVHRGQRPGSALEAQSLDTEPNGDGWHQPERQPAPSQQQLSFREIRVAGEAILTDAQRYLGEECFCLAQMDMNVYWLRECFSAEGASPRARPSCLSGRVGPTHSTLTTCSCSPTPP